MLKRAFIFGLSILCSPLFAQPLAVPEVPHKMNFAGITLTIRDDARREIQKDVDALMQSPRHFQIKVERAKAYFPIIEKIFAEENLPNDFKYLVLQESALIGDAVSVSNAVGFWQFKDFTAREVGLRVDDVVDERMNIASATRGAARYIKKNNYQFNNWIYALQAYQMGAGGVSRAVRDVESGVRHMTITSQTYWYVKKFLAHKIAFEGALETNSNTSLQITWVSNNTIQSIQEQTGLEETKLRALNLWIRKNVIPDDKQYALILPKNDGSTLAQPEKLISTTTKPSTKSKTKESAKQYLHGIPVVYAQGGESISALAQKSGLSLPAFMRYNDLHGNEKIQTNVPYYLKAKHKKSKKINTQLKEGQTLWQISQQEGIRLTSLKKFNRNKIETLQPGETIWLTTRKNKNENQSELTTLQEPTLDNATFNWEIVLSTDSASILPVQTKEKLATTEQKENTDSDKQTNILPTLRQIPADGLHEVRPGETLSAISRLYGIDVEKLQLLNNLVGTTIQPGQKLKLTEQTSQAATVKNVLWHEVKPGQTLYAIARQYGVTIKEICDWNDKKDFDVKPGDKIKIEVNKKEIDNTNR